MEETDLTIPTDTLALGKQGEGLAAVFLESAGYELVASNFTVPVGRNRLGALINAEIDVIAYDDAVLCFIEVKTRASDWFAPPHVNVDLRKQRQIARAARAYRRLFGLSGALYRFDVVSVTVSPVDRTPESADVTMSPANVSVSNKARPSTRVELLRNFWRDDKFRKRKWSDTHFDY